MKWVGKGKAKGQPMEARIDLEGHCQKMDHVWMCIFLLIFPDL